MKAKFARHRCNACKRIFDCEPCTHGKGEDWDRTFCSAACQGRDLAVLPLMPHRPHGFGTVTLKWGRKK